MGKGFVLVGAMRMLLSLLLLTGPKIPLPEKSPGAILFRGTIFSGTFHL